MNKFVLAGIFMAASTLAFAEVPVVDYSSDASSSAIAQPMDEQSTEAIVSADETTPPQPSRQNLSTEQRLNKVEAQVDNLNRQNLSSKLSELQDKVQQMSGKLDEQSHQLDQLSNQTKSYYQDLNQRVEKGKTPVNPVPAPTVSTVTTTTSADTAKPGKTTITTTTTKKPTQAAIDAANLKEQQLYQTAVDILADKKYDESSQKLNDYLKKYPHGAYVSNAHYWLGEIAFLQKNYAKAESEFKTVVNKYVDSKKVSDAWLKLALVHENQGKHDQAREELKLVIKKYPNTTAAQLAKQQLEAN